MEVDNHPSEGSSSENPSKQPSSSGVPLEEERAECPNEEDVVMKEDPPQNEVSSSSHHEEEFAAPENIVPPKQMVPKPQNPKASVST